MSRRYGRRPSRLSRFSRGRRSQITVDKNKRSLRVANAEAICTVYNRSNVFRFADSRPKNLFYWVSYCPINHVWQLNWVENSKPDSLTINSSNTSGSYVLYSDVATSVGVEQSGLGPYFQKYRNVALKRVSVTWMRVNTGFQVDVQPSLGAFTLQTTITPGFTVPVQGVQLQSTRQKLYALTFPKGLFKDYDLYDIDDVVHSPYSRGWDATRVKKMSFTPSTFVDRIYSTMSTASNPGVMKDLSLYQTARAVKLPTEIDYNFPTGAFALSGFSVTRPPMPWITASSPNPVVPIYYRLVIKFTFGFTRLRADYANLTV